MRVLITGITEMIGSYLPARPGVRGSGFIPRHIRQLLGYTSTMTGSIACNELAGIMMLEDLAGFLETVALPRDSYPSAYYALSQQLRVFAAEQKGFIWQEEARAYIRTIAHYMTIWCDAYMRLR